MLARFRKYLRNARGGYVDFKKFPIKIFIKLLTRSQRCVIMKISFETKFQNYDNNFFGSAYNASGEMGEK